MLVVACLGLAFLTFALGLNFRISRIVLLTAVLLLAGFATIVFKSMLVASPPLAKPWVGTISARIERVEDISARGAVRLWLATGGHQGLPEKIRVNLPIERNNAQFRPGTVIEAKVRLMPPPGPALPGGYDFARQAWFDELGATGSVLGQPNVRAPTTAEGPFWKGWRDRIATHVYGSMGEATGPIGAALLVGSRGAIAEADAEALRNSGMAHLLSVSGLHVTAIVGGTFFVIAKLLALFPWFALRFRVPLVAGAGAALVAVGYTLLTGAEVPTVRACIAALLVLVALASGREPLSLRLLAAGALFVLIFWPESLAGPSFQLSFAAVATIISLHESAWMRRLVARRDDGLFRRVGIAVVSLLLTGLAIEIVLAPIALFHFHKSGVYGALANIIAIPLTTFLIMPMQILALVMDAFGMGQPFWWLAGKGVALILWLAHFVDSAPGAVMALPSMPRWAFAFMVVGGLWLAVFAGRAKAFAMSLFAAGTLGAFFAPHPDLLVTGDGRHLALVSDGKIILLRPKVGEYALSMLSENAAIQTPPIALDDWPDAQCSADFCSFAIESNGRRWNVLAARSPYLVPAMELAAACKRADIVVSERYLPYSCKPRWIKADRAFLQANGGLAFYLSDQRLKTVGQTTRHQPWSQPRIEVAAKR
ncbi:MAG: ComEC/Rec2 family competence protein [Sphingomonadales bacterium]|nr:ComEC/Rec2 family competence protein [Sphingomonadales bacterium]MBL0022885.1 ComEC/Rec2 family competence protein [Sphingomonadales bacterium]